MPTAQIVMFAVSILVVALSVWWALEKRKERDARWRSYAKIRGARFVEGQHGLFVNQASGIERRMQQAIVFVDTYVVSHGKTSTTYTRARARFANGGGPRFSVYADGLLSSLGKALGAQDVVLGGPTAVDSRFDDAFVVKCDDDDAVRAVWTRDAKASLLLGERGPVRVDSDGVTVTVLVVGAADESSELDALFDLAGALASYGARELASLAELPGARHEPSSGPWESATTPTLTIETPRGEVSVLVLTSRGRPRLQLVLKHRREIPPFSTDLRGGLAVDLPRGLVTDAAKPLLEAVSGASLVGDSRLLRLTWPTIPEPAEITSGASLLGALASPSTSTGAFR